jgi:hypothetical protein
MSHSLLHFEYPHVEKHANFFVLIDNSLRPMEDHSTNICEAFAFWKKKRLQYSSNSNSYSRNAMCRNVPAESKAISSTMEE